MLTLVHRIPLSVLSVCLFGSALASCSPNPVTLTAEKPLERIVVSQIETLLYAEPGTHLSDLISIEPFRTKNLRPGMTAREVEKFLGAPDYRSKERKGRDEVFGFHTKSGAIELIKQHVASEGVAIDRWFLRHRPQDCAPLVDPRLLRQVQDLEPFPREVILFSGLDRRGMAILEFNKERACTAIWWLQQDTESEAVQPSDPVQ